MMSNRIYIKIIKHFMDMETKNNRVLFEIKAIASKNSIKLNVKK